MAPTIGEIDVPKRDVAMPYGLPVELLGVDAQALPFERCELFTANLVPAGAEGRVTLEPFQYKVHEGHGVNFSPQAVALATRHDEVLRRRWSTIGARFKVVFGGRITGEADTGDVGMRYHDMFTVEALVILQPEELHDVRHATLLFLKGLSPHRNTKHAVTAGCGGENGRRPLGAGRFRILRSANQRFSPVTYQSGVDRGRRN